MGKINYRTDDINKKLKQIDELVGSNNNLSNQINNFNSQLEQNTNQINNFNSQLEQKANESEVNKRLSFRNFKPIFGYNCIWGEIWGTDGTHTQKNRIEIGNDIKHCEELGIDGSGLPLIFTLSIQFPPPA